jgi:hypothetical protein
MDKRTLYVIGDSQIDTLNEQNVTIATSLRALMTLPPASSSPVSPTLTAAQVIRKLPPPVIINSVPSTTGTPQFTSTLPTTYIMCGTLP